MIWLSRYMLLLVACSDSAGIVYISLTQREPPAERNMDRIWLWGCLAYLLRYYAAVTFVIIACGRLLSLITSVDIHDISDSMISIASRGFIFSFPFLLSFFFRIYLWFFNLFQWVQQLPRICDIYMRTIRILMCCQHSSLCQDYWQIRSPIGLVRKLFHAWISLMDLEDATAIHLTFYLFIDVNN